MLNSCTNIEFSKLIPSWALSLTILVMPSKNSSFFGPKNSGLAFLEATIFRILCAKNYDDRFKLNVQWIMENWDGEESAYAEKDIVYW